MVPIHWRVISQRAIIIAHHNIRLSLGVAQIWVQPIHKLLHLLPVEEDDENKEQEVEHAQTWHQSDNRDVVLESETSGVKVITRSTEHTELNSPKTIRHIAGCGLVNGPRKQHRNRIKDSI